MDFRELQAHIFSTSAKSLYAVFILFEIETILQLKQEDRTFKIKIGNDALEGHRSRIRTEWEKKASKKGVRRKKAELGWSRRK